MEVGIRELKAKLSEYVARASTGESIVVTDRGQPVARLVGLHNGDRVQKGIEEDWIEPPRRTKLTPSVRYRASGSVMDVLSEDRG